MPPLPASKPLVAGLILIAMPSCDLRASKPPARVERGAAAVIPSPSMQSQLHVVRTGFDVRKGRVSFSALLKNPLPHTVTAPKLTVRMNDSKGEELSSFGDSPPFCPARRECWWGASFSTRSFAPLGDLKSIDVTVTDDGERPHGLQSPKLQPFDARRRPDGTVTGVVPSDEGRAFLISFVDGKARGGISSNVGEGLGRPIIRVPASIFPRPARNETILGFMYAFPVPRGS